jgi:Zn-dependent peptidase ImmA (M78 family)
MAVSVLGDPNAAAEARRARDELGVGATAPLPDLLKLVELGARLPVALLALPEGIAGAYGRKDGYAFIFISSAHPPTRRRFTLAHEFGHHVLRHAGMIDVESDLAGDSRSPREQAANAFAAEFLVPSTAVDRWCDANGAGEVDLEAVVRLACFFNVSAEVAKNRFKSTRRIRKGQQLASIEAAIGRGDHLRLSRKLDCAPEGDSLDRIALGATRVPSTMFANALTAYEAGLVSLDKAAEMLRTDPAQLREKLIELEISPPEEESLY